MKKVVMKKGCMNCMKNYNMHIEFNDEEEMRKAFESGLKGITFKCPECSSIIFENGRDTFDIEKVFKKEIENKSEISWPSSIYNILDIAHGSEWVKRNLEANRKVKIPFSIEGNEYITSVVIDDSNGFENISMFFPNLKKVKMSSNINEIGDKCFFGNESIEEIEIPASVTSIGRQIFYGCSNLKKVTIDDDNPIYKIDGNCLLTKDDVLLETFGNFIIPNYVKKISSFCFQSYFLNSLILPNDLQEIGDMAFDCCNIKSISIGSSVSHISPTAFSGAYNLDHISINSKNPFYSTLNHASIYDKRNNKLITCKTSIDETYEDENIKIIGSYCFYRAENIEHCIIPDSVIHIEEYAFGYCYDLKSIILSKKLEAIGDYALCGTSLKEITIPDSVHGIGVGCFKDCGQLKNITLSSNIEEIPENLFVACVKLNNLFVPQNVRTIGKFAFRNSGIKEITLNEGLESILYGAFSETSQLDSIVIPKTVKFIDETAFDGSSISKIIIDSDNPVYMTNSNGTKIFNRIDKKEVIDIEQTKYVHKYYEIDNDGSDF